LFRGKNLPASGEAFEARGSFVELESGNAEDWRVRINCNFGLFGDGAFGLLQETNGVVWPYNPSITIGTKANYSPLDPVHNNYTMWAYKSSSVNDIQISGEFSCETEEDAAYWIQATTFFKASTKMFFGKSTNAGNPPIICNLSGEYYIFDGQHRYNAIFEIITDDLNMEWDINVYIEIYFIEHEDIESNVITMELFKMANKTLSFDVANDTPDEYLQKLIRSLCKDPLFSNNLVNKNKVYRPKISKYELAQEFKKTFKMDVYPPIEKVIELIKGINNELSINKEKAIGKFKKTDVYKKREEAYNKAVEKKFLLNLEYYNPVMWINDLVQKITEN
jgi:hypothetical protein